MHPQRWGPIACVQYRWGWSDVCGNKVSRLSRQGVKETRHLQFQVLEIDRLVRQENVCGNLGKLDWSFRMSI